MVGPPFHGRVVGIEKDFAIIDVGLKTEGRVSLKEFGAADGKPAIKVGDNVEVYLERVENAMGEAVISREKARREEAWTRLEGVFAKNEPVMGTIVGRVKGGFTVDLGGASAFLPGSQVDIRPENLGRRCKLELGLVGDVGATIEALLPKLTAKTDSQYLDDSIAHYRKARAGLDDLARGLVPRELLQQAMAPAMGADREAVAAKRRGKRARIIDRLRQRFGGVGIMAIADDERELGRLVRGQRRLLLGGDGLGSIQGTDG